MSAICGIYNRHGAPLPTQALGPIMDAMAAYQRDGGHTWAKDEVSLGQQMTWITAESLEEKLPFEESRSKMVITADARLDNRQSLFSLLGIAAAEKAAYPDSMLILKAYQRWGVDCPTHLLGDFAFAIWDGQEQRLFCARDILGVRPFYYYLRNGTFCFASDLAALLSSTEVVTELSLPYVRAYLEQPGFYHKEYTFYEDVFKLLPAHSILITRERVQRREYWLPADAHKIRYRHEAEYIEHLREILEQAVECRLRSAYPVGSHLSGGLDSSTVSVLASRMLPTKQLPLHAFSWSPPPKSTDYLPDDERTLIKTICRNEGIIIHYTDRQVKDVAHDLNLDITTQPNLTGLNEQFVSRMAARLGIRVMLSGWGGDEFAAFNGRGYFADLFRRLRWITMTRELYLRARLQEWNFWAGFRSSVILPLVPDKILSILRPDSYSLPKRLPLPESLQPEFASQLQAIEPFRKPHLRERPGVRQNQIDLLNNGHLTERMESWALLGATSGIEYRYPLVDRRIIEYSLGIPSWLYFKNGWKRYQFRCTIEGILPQEVQWKKIKSDPAWLRAQKSDNTELLTRSSSEILAQRKSIRAAGFVNPDILVKEIAQLQGQINSGNQSKIEDINPPIWLTKIKGTDRKIN